MYLRIVGIAIIILSAVVGWKFYESYTAYDKLQATPHNQYIGAENPSLIITEVMDYRCGYCRELHGIMAAFLERHPDVRVVYRVYPIFGHPSMNEAKIAMAAGKQGKFREMHELLIRSSAPVTPEQEDRMVMELGLDRMQYNADKYSWSTTKDLMDSTSAAKALGIRATPTLIVNNQILKMGQGAPTVEKLEELFAPFLKTATPEQAAP